MKYLIDIRMIQEDMQTIQVEADSASDAHRKAMLQMPKLVPNFGPVSFSIANLEPMTGPRRVVRNG